MLSVLLYRIYFYCFVLPVTACFVVFKKRGMYQFEYFYCGDKKVVIPLFNSKYKLVRFIKLPLLVLSKELSLVGGYMSKSPYKSEVNSTPGLISLYSLRLLLCFPDLCLEECEEEYSKKKSFKYDMGLFCKYIFSKMLYGKNGLTVKEKFNLFSIPLLNTTTDEFMNNLEEKRYESVFFLNAENANQTFKCSDYKRYLVKNNCNLIDGIGVKIASNFLNIKIRENMNGTDLFPKIMQQASKNRKRVYLLGATDKVLEDMIVKIKESYPSVIVCGSQNGYFNKEDSKEIIDSINESKADYLFVGMGTPLQEKWVSENRCLILAETVFAVGGLFDFISEHKRRAPIIIRELGLEWLFRLFLEPRRLFKRYVIGNVVFLWRAYVHSKTVANWNMIQKYEAK